MTISPETLEAAARGIHGPDAQSNMLAALLPFAQVGLEGAFSNGDVLRFVVAGEALIIGEADFLRAYLVWQLYDPAARASTVASNPKLAALQDKVYNSQNEYEALQSALFDNCTVLRAESDALLARAVALKDHAIALMWRTGLLGFVLGYVVAVIFA